MCAREEAMDDGAVDDARDRARDRCAWVRITSSRWGVLSLIVIGGMTPD